MAQETVHDYRESERQQDRLQRAASIPRAKQCAGGRYAEKIKRGGEPAERHCGVLTGCIRFVTEGSSKRHRNYYRGAQQDKGTEDPHDGARRNLVAKCGHTEEPGHRGYTRDKAARSEKQSTAARVVVTKSPHNR